jgi:hypothetical protein
MYRIYEHFDGKKIHYTVKKRSWLLWKSADSHLLSRIDYDGSYFPLKFETFELASKAVYDAIDEAYAKMQNKTYTKVVDEIDVDRDYPMI